MKTSKSPENKEVTPSKKKLKQARLPFKLISDVSPKPTAPQTRKRKLSLPEAEPVTKVGKICKENDFAKDLVVISDEETREEPSEQEVKQVNPLVKLVDKARKKKLQKKTPKKKNKSSKKLTNGVTDKIETPDDDFGDVEMVEVDVIIHEDADESETKTDLPDKDSVSTKPPDQTEKSAEKVPTETVSSIICLEDSNQSSDLTDSIKKSTVDSHTQVTINTNDTETDKKQKQSEICETEKLDTKPDNPADPKETSKSDDPVTPKRSARNKSKNETSIPNASTSKLDELVNSNPSTPKRNTSSVHDESMNDSTISANLTPKQIQKKLESAKKREEREKEKQERERKRQEEKDERAKQRQEKEEQRKRERDEKEELRKRERDEKEEQKKKEREEKEKLREMERKLKEMKEELKRKEKEEKEEQKKKEREAREEEKRKKQEALELEKQEQELKKKKAAEAFANFFVPKQKVEKDQVSEPISKNSALSSFRVKVDMRLAPTTRNNLGEERKEALEKYIEEQDENASYLKNLKDGAKPLSSRKTWPLSDKDNDDDVMIVEDELPPMDGAEEIITCEPAPREKLRPKLFSFHENRRPPYWGTWRKKSTAVKPRRPFGQDEKQLDYEVDSDDDWEEEQEGESLDGSACGSEEEGDRADDYEVDNELFVPHGYLSDESLDGSACGSEDEGDRADDYEVDNELFVPHGYLSDEEATMDEDDVLSLSPDAQKAKLKYLEDEFESEMKKPTEKLKPRLYGLLWESKEGGKPDNCVDALWNYFGKFAMIMNDPTPLLQPAPETEDAEKKRVKKKKPTTEGDEQSPKSEKKKKAKPEKETKKPKAEVKKVVPNQPGINSFLTKLKTA